MSILQEAEKWELDELVRSYTDMIKHLTVEDKNGVRVVGTDGLVEYYQSRLDDVQAELNKRK